jgi:hypothetical protein
VYALRGIHSSVKVGKRQYSLIVLSPVADLSAFVLLLSSPYLSKHFLLLSAAVGILSTNHYRLIQ